MQLIFSAEEATLTAYSIASPTIGASSSTAFRLVFLLVQVTIPLQKVTPSRRRVRDDI